MEEKGLIESEWGVTENNRRAKFYSLTRKGRTVADAELDSWLRLSKGQRRRLDLGRHRRRRLQRQQHPAIIMANLPVAVRASIA